MEVIVKEIKKYGEEIGKAESWRKYKGIEENEIS